MARGHLREKTVQGKALEWLENNYRNGGDFVDSKSKLEARVRKDKKLGSNGRADGLIVLKRKDGSLHTISLEAKSSRLLATLTGHYLDEKWLLHACLVGLLFSLILVLVGWNSWAWIWLIVGSVLTFFVTGFIFLLITQEHRWYRGVDVIAQVKRYPANEQWIVLSTDVYNQLKTKRQDEQDKLIQACRENGIGLLTVSAGNKIKLMIQPKTKKVPKGYRDFLVCYHAEKALRHQLENTLVTPQFAD